MISILSKSGSNQMNGIDTPISKATNNAKNAIGSILLAGSILLGVNANADINKSLQENNQNKNIIHKVIRGDTLSKIARKYGVKISYLKKINNIVDINHINAGTTLQIHNKPDNKTNVIQGRIIAIKENIRNIENQISEIKEHKHSKKSPLKNKEQLNNNSTNILLPKAIKSYGMYKKVGTKYKRFYTISPKSNKFEGDTPYFTGSIKKFNGRVYVEVRLANDKDITGYISLGAFNNEGKKIINEYHKENKLAKKIEVKKERKVIIKEVEQVKTVEKESKIEKKNNKKIKTKSTLNKPIRNTIRFAGSSINYIGIDKIHNQSLLDTLNLSKNTLERIESDDMKRNFLDYKISVLKLNINYKEISKDLPIEELFDEYATLERLKISFKYYKNISPLNYYNNHIVRRFGGDWNIAETLITRKLGLDESIYVHNPKLKKALDEGRNQGIENLKNTISKAEGTHGNYNAIYGNGKQDNFKYHTKTINQVLNKMRSRFIKSKTTATGKYQIILTTLKEYCISKNIDKSKVLFDEKFQEDFFISKLEDIGLENFKRGILDRDRFQVMLSGIWASIAKDESNKSFYHGDGTNKAFCSNNEIDSILDNIKNPKLTNEALLASL